MFTFTTTLSHPAIKRWGHPVFTAPMQPERRQYAPTKPVPSARADIMLQRFWLMQAAAVRDAQLDPSVA